MQATISHASLGTVQYEASLGWYEGTTTIAEELLSFYLSAESETESVHSLSTAESCWPRLPAFVASAKSFAANRLLALKNGEWSDEDGKQVSHQQFVERLATESIVFYPDGDIELTFKDGGLFFGHVVLVAATTEGFADATIAG